MENALKKLFSQKYISFGLIFMSIFLTVAQQRLFSVNGGMQSVMNGESYAIRFFETISCYAHVDDAHHLNYMA